TVGRPQQTLSYGMSALTVAMAGNAKYTKCMFIDVAYEYILNGTATSILSDILRNTYQFGNVTKIIVDMSVGNLVNVSNEAACASNINS
ncbi:hypothetical protein GGI20_006346, partial [Coemansia sp. BCRC 34301]